MGVVVDGCPPRLALTADDIQRDLDRRRPGQSRLVTQRDEADRVEILSGLFEGVTLGTAIALLVRNTDARSGAYEDMRDVYRPSHADYTYEAKYGVRNWQGGGRASARETVARVAAGAIARKLLQTAGIEVLAWVSQVHDIDALVDPAAVTLEDVEASPTRCPSPMHATRMVEAIERGFPQKEIAESAYRFQQAVERREKAIVGVNEYVQEDESPIETLYIDESAADAQLTKLAALRQSRDNGRVLRALDRLQAAALSSDNLMAPILEAVRAYATLGEMCDALREVWGEYEEVPII